MVYPGRVGVEKIIPPYKREKNNSQMAFHADSKTVHFFVSDVPGPRNVKKTAWIGPLSSFSIILVIFFGISQSRNMWQKKIFTVLESAWKDRFLYVYDQTFEKINFSLL